MDGITIFKLVQELGNELNGARIEKVHQPGGRDIVLTIRTRKSTKKLLISASREFPRVHFLSSQKPENPERPPLFCVAMRKRLEGGRILDIRGREFDRVVEIIVEHLNEIGDLETCILIAELMGKNSNIILCLSKDNNLKIIDSIVHVTPDMSRFRTVLPGQTYVGPPKLTKPDFRSVTEENISLPNVENLCSKENIRELMRLAAGLGPVSAREVLYRAQNWCQKDEGKESYKFAIVHEFKSLFLSVIDGPAKPSVGLDELSRPTDCAPFPLSSYERYQTCNTMSEAIELSFSEKTTRVSISALSAKLISAIEANLDKLRGKLAKISQLEEESIHHEQLRIYGELLTTYGHMVSKGQSSVLLPNFYEENNLVRIEIEPALSAIENAQKYFKQSSKRKRSIAILKAERQTAESDMAYLENVLAYIQQAKGDKDTLSEIQLELETEGFLKSSSNRQKQQRKSSSKETKGVPQALVTRDGFTIRIGRNNAQNDRLTLKLSKSHDIWMHVKDVPGSHVVIEAGNRQIPNSALEKAAILAAYFSKAQNSSNVPVDYTEIRNVWKPNGARPGHVLYKHQKTLFVNPDRNEVESLLGNNRSKN